MKRLIITLLIFNVFTTFAQREVLGSFDVKKVGSEFFTNGNQLFYSLPKNNFIIGIRVKKTTLVKGPYSKYASKYLNISEGIIFEDDELFEIDSISIVRTSLPDTTNIFAINAESQSIMPGITLNSSGVIVGYNIPANQHVEYFTTKTPQYIFTPEDDDFIFTDLGIKPFIVSKKETVYTTIKTDSVPVKVSKSQTKLVATTTEENAIEAADAIRKIRKRRMKLIMGIKDETFAVKGDALELMLDELKKIEQNYIELFIGKTIEHSHTYYFEFTPDHENDIEQNTLCWLSSRQGISTKKPDLRHGNYKPVIIKTSPAVILPGINIQTTNKTQKTPSPIHYGLYYRIPGRSYISVEYNSTMLYMQQWEIAQKGVAIPLPSKYLNSEKYSILYYPETGALKRINLNSTEPSID